MFNTQNPANVIDKPTTIINILIHILLNVSAHACGITLSY